MKKLILVGLALSCLPAFAQWSDFSAFTTASNLYGAMNGKINGRTVSTLPSTCTAALDNVVLTGTGVEYFCWPANVWNAIPLASQIGISSIGMSLPSIFAVSPNPLTANGTFTVSFAGGQTPHLVLGTCGSATAFGGCSLGLSDLPGTVVNTLGTYTDPPWLTLSWTGGQITGIPSFGTAALQNNPLTTNGDFLIWNGGAFARLANPGTGTYCPSFSSGTSAPTWGACPAGNPFTTTTLYAPSTSGTTTVSYNSITAAKVVPTAGSLTITLSITPPTSNISTPMLLGMCNPTGVTEIWNLPGNVINLSTPSDPGECVWQLVAYDSIDSTFNGPGSTSPPSIAKYSNERADLTSNITAGGETNPNSTDHNFHFTNSSGVHFAMVKIGSSTNSYDLSGDTWMIPSASSAVASAASMFIFDTATGNAHLWNGADGILPTVATVPTSGHCPQFLVVSGLVSFVDSGGGCGGGSSVWSGIGNAIANLTLANAGYSTTFHQTSQVTWTWGNTTAATSGVEQGPPILAFSGAGWTTNTLNSYATGFSITYNPAAWSAYNGSDTLTIASTNALNHGNRVFIDSTTFNSGLYAGAFNTGGGCCLAGNNGQNQGYAFNNGMALFADTSTSLTISVGGASPTYENLKLKGIQSLGAVTVASLPACAAGTLGTRQEVSDATSATPGTAAAGSGTYTVGAECIFNSSGSVYSWIIN